MNPGRFPLSQCAHRNSLNGFLKNTPTHTHIDVIVVNWNSEETILVYAFFVGWRLFVLNNRIKKYLICIEMWCLFWQCIKVDVASTVGVWALRYKSYSDYSDTVMITPCWSEAWLFLTILKVVHTAAVAAVVDIHPRSHGFNRV